jgi:signal transduction histidine kinase
MQRFQSMTSKQTDPILSLDSICVNYSGFKAIKEISLNIFPGEIHAIVGEHGAGKSSLGQVLSGIQKSSSGKIFFNNQILHQNNIKNAQRLGIRMVYQEPFLNEYFSVAENLFYSRKYSDHLGFYNKQEVISKAEKYLTEHGISIDPNIKVSALNLSDRTVIDILGNLYEEPRILILDEALERLSTESYDLILPLLKKIRDSGTAIISITHKIDDVYNFANKVTVIKNGELLLTDFVDNIGKLNLIRMTYTQVGIDSKQAKLDKEFYQFLKFNEAILRYLPVNIIVVDDNLATKMVNEYFSSSFMLESVNIINLPLREVLTGNPEALADIENCLKNEETRTVYNVELLINGVTSVNNIKTFPIRDGHTLIGSILIIEDVTEYDKLQKQLILSEKLGAVGLLAAGVAHEINNPLEIISNYLNFIKLRIIDKEVLKSIEEINMEITSISQIVSNLVSFGDSKRIIEEQLDINEIIQEILLLLKYNAEYKHIKIEFTPGEGELLFNGNRDEFKQVILNLIKNSFEAMPDGGIIMIKTQNIILNDRSMIRVDFQDNGPGINSVNADNIFMPFFSTKAKTSSNLGLGLSISYRLIEKIGGDMSVANQISGGCKFTIELPSANS